MYKFENLTVWKKSVHLIEEAYKVIALLPTSERFGLVDQLRRAIISISLNIAEGSGADTDKEFCRYLYLSRKSLYEVVAIIKIIERLYPGVDIEVLVKDIEEVSKILSGLIKKLKTSRS